jgi:2-methylisocitrate lyase-like PEP mutase family enzyme
MRQVVGRGAVGINLEDGTGDSDQPLDPPELVAEKIIAVREATRDDIHLVINARTDVFLVRAGDPDSWLIETLRRLHVFRDAGADCLFVPGGLPRETIAILARDAGGPLNVVANPAISIPVVPSIPELRDLGVARVSVGAGAMRATLAYTRRVAEELLGPGTYDVMRGELDRPDAPDAYRMAIGDG